ncbi:hypothetical protein CSIRO_0189 [Bradyrhizobiaceae bacterium SG-6C]|nr:hypothetical protein CSIRO_0189 [Bradyrhizobiaceae bacterium SG-6C]
MRPERLAGHAPLLELTIDLKGRLAEYVCEYASSAHERHMKDLAAL